MGRKVSARLLTERILASLRELQDVGDPDIIAEWAAFLSSIRLKR